MAIAVFAVVAVVGLNPPVAWRPLPRSRRPATPTRSSGGVPDFWSRLKGKFGGTEYVEDFEQDGYGIGIRGLARGACG